MTVLQYSDVANQCAVEEKLTKLLSLILYRCTTNARVARPFDTNA